MTVGRIPNVEGGIQPTLLTTAGDIMYASSASNPDRLGIGTAGQVLQVNSGATAPEWATPSSGGMTLLSTTTLSGATTNITSIDQTYTHLQMIIEGLTLSSSEDILIKFNTTQVPSLVGQNLTTNWDKASGEFIPSGNSALAIVIYNIFNYSSTTAHKGVSGVGNGTSTNSNIFGGRIGTTSAISAINFSAGGAVTYTGGTVRLFGVK
jgi:hypothetical protein